MSKSQSDVIELCLYGTFVLSIKCETSLNWSHFLDFMMHHLLIYKCFVSIYLALVNLAILIDSYKNSAIFK